MSDKWKVFWILTSIAIAFIIITSLITYYLSRWLAKWLKNVQRIDKRRDLYKSTKLKEIVRIVREVSNSYKIKMPEVGVYPSNEVNAFATGPANGTLIAFSSNLIKIMSMEEIRGVVGHELSHLINYDIRNILIVQGIFDFIHWVFTFLLYWWLFQPDKKREDKEVSAGRIVRRFFLMILFHIIAGIFRLIGVMIIFWYNRKREYAADLKGAEIVGVDDMLATLRKLLELENKAWVVDGIDLTEDENVQGEEPNSLSLLKFNAGKKSRGLLDLFRTHPTLEDRIKKLEKLKKKKSGAE